MCCLGDPQIILRYKGQGQGKAIGVQAYYICCFVCIIVVVLCVLL